MSLVSHSATALTETMKLVKKTRAVVSFMVVDLSAATGMKSKVNELEEVRVMVMVDQ